MIELLKRPQIIGICADANAGKSNVIYNLIEQLKGYDCNVYAYGLRKTPQRVREIHSIEELEIITDSIIIIDEMFSLFDLDDRKQKKAIEATFRLLYHNNNVIILSGLPENFRKFISSKINTIIFKKVTIPDCINGSTIKRIIMSYSGAERGSAMLNIPINKALIYDGRHYQLIDVPYQEAYDSKKGNLPILRREK